MLFPLTRYMQGHLQGAHGLIRPLSPICRALCLPRHGSELSLLPGKPLIRPVRPAYGWVLRSTYPFEPAAICHDCNSFPDLAFEARVHLVLLRRPLLRVEQPERDESVPVRKRWWFHPQRARRHPTIVSALSVLRHRLAWPTSWPLAKPLKPTWMLR